MGFKAILASTDVNEFEWATPQKLFDELNAEFHFTLDPCASVLNHKCDKYYTKEDDGLSKSWNNEIVFCNPPYGRQTGLWVKKASETKGGVIVMLLPSRTDTAWFHDYIYHKAEIRFLRGRLHYNDGKQSAPFGSLIAIYKAK